MKKLIFLSATLTALFSLNANAQTVPATAVTPPPATATLNVRLYPVQNIVVNADQKVVNLDYKTAADYAKGVEIEQKNHLEIYSTGAFAVTVNSMTDKLTNTSNETIDSKDITITPSEGTKKLTSASTLTPAKLGMDPKTLISSSVGSNSATFNINYSAKGGDDSYINKYTSGKTGPTVYTTQVIYTIATQ